MDLLITGAAGFLGSHFLFNWLRQYSGSNALCLVRGTEGQLAVERVSQALATAAFECDSAISSADLMNRITVVDANLNNTSWRQYPYLLAWLEQSAGFEVVHGAANLSFRENDREQVWQTNVTGTINFMRSLSGLVNMRNFNYISTAYVAGNKEGVLLEKKGERPTRFNNVYEESKWAAEEIVREIGYKINVGIRIFRPSIIIGHSQTYRECQKFCV